MNLRYRVLLFTMLLAVTGGCSLFQKKPTVVILKHPETLDFVDCKVGKWEMPESYSANDLCIEEYKKKGYEVWGKR